MRPATEKVETLFVQNLHTERKMKIMKKLSAHPYAQCEIITTPNSVACKSYNTIVATITNGWLVINGLYSQTTRRHIGAFVKEYANLTYATAKRLYEDSFKYNIHTGEICPI